MVVLAGNDPILLGFASSTQPTCYLLGDVEAERFIALIQREPFDYTKWRQELDEDLSRVGWVEERNPTQQAGHLQCLWVLPEN